MVKSRPCNQSAVCYAVVNVMSSCCLLLDARPTSPSLLDNTGHPAHEHQSQVTKILLNETALLCFNTFIILKKPNQTLSTKSRDFTIRKIDSIDQVFSAFIIIKESIYERICLMKCRFCSCMCIKKGVLYENSI